MFSSSILAMVPFEDRPPSEQIEWASAGVQNVARQLAELSGAFRVTGNDHMCAELRRMRVNLEESVKQLSVAKRGL